ncbi:hypothetical protein [Agromyces seonyuensis]|uniref:Uncharacterized protein n=1 Tax=Agromyces seonyuensis TaxID=2662446 RepID=A0A6I4NXX9_9MICO|nr:hypothetical protein [Agromyces seonyuensis]MWB99031.1 hypothetical protein [Agromyces seonyuensis]
MAESAETPWVQSNLGASIFGGAVVLILGALGNTLVEDMPNWLRWVVTAGAVLIGLMLFSAINETWRNRVWVRIGSSVAGLRPVRIVTLRKKVAEAESAAEKRYNEALQARAESPSPPAWTIRYDRRMGHDEFDNDTFWLTNMGFPVTEVEVVGDSEFIELPHRVIFQAHENGTGRWFAGNITERGRREGVTLTITHRNRHGEPGSFDYQLEPETIAEMKLETREEAYARGKADGNVEGHTLGVEAGRRSLQSEIDAQRAKPVRKPRWAVMQTTSGTWALTNNSDGAVATAVTLDAAPTDFTFHSAADWEHLTGIAGQTFQGQALGAGGHVAFTVEWNDVNGIRQSTSIHWYPPPAIYGGPISVGGGNPIPDF